MKRKFFSIKLILERLLFLYREHRHDTKVLIYQMGKVGSSSLEAALPDSVHLHTLYGYPPAKKAVDFKRRSFIKSMRRVLYWWLLRQTLKRHKRIKIITLVRDPLQREVSQFFQDIEHWLSFHSLSKKIDTRGEDPELVSKCFEQSYDFEYGRFWYQREIGRFTGIDIKSFEHRAVGCATASHGKFDVIMVRLDKLKENISLLEDFLGIELDVGHSNAGSNKWYECIYNKFRCEYTPPPFIINDIYTNNWVRFMYSPDEWAGMKSKHDSGVSL